MKPPRFTSLDEWLSWQETLHPSEIELGLDRVSRVFQTLHPEPPPFKVITVAGTNGKGSSVAMLDAIYRAAGYQVGSYTSPHLIRYNERVCLNGESVNDAPLVDAFTRIDTARADTSLTYFEFGTLAALDIFYRYADTTNGIPLDVVILEVGLGGRLDAVNIIDPDIALITSISVDHTAWLGDNREAIAREKAGIMRAAKAVVFSGRDMPRAIETRADELGADLYVLDRDYHYSPHEQGWQWQDTVSPVINLPLPTLKGEHQLQNAAGAIMVTELMKETLPVNNQVIRQGLLAVQLGGRFQQFSGDIIWLFDVAHNPESMAQLATLLQAQSVTGTTRFVVGMLKDKDARHALRFLAPLAGAWYVASLPTPRSFMAEELAVIVQEYGHHAAVSACDSIADACGQAKQQSMAGDRIVVCGSFYTVAEALQAGIY